MESEGTLLLRRQDVAALLTFADCIAAVEKVFRGQGEGKVPAPEILGVKTSRGGLHVKAGFLPSDRGYLVAKINTNFPGNPRQFGRPTIQGLIVVADAETGQPLAVLDSIEVTIKRTAAASAVAAKYLARKNSTVATICGCGEQGRAQLRALCLVLPLTKIYAFDRDENVAEKFAKELSGELSVEIEMIRDVNSALRKSDVCVTCTPAREFFVRKEDVAPGTFIAAVGADSEEKQEIDPQLMALSKVVADSLEQCKRIGDLHHTIAQGLMHEKRVYAELAEIVAERKSARTNAEEIFVFDSTGVAIEDAVAAALVYEKASVAGIGSRFAFAA